jgi:copper(I)-binding protein
MAMPRLYLSFLLLLVTIVSTPARAQNYSSGDLTVSRPWARATVGVSRPAAVYLTIRNIGKQADELTAASTSVAGRAEIHQSQKVGDVMKMSAMPTVPVGAGQTVTFAPGGYHIMLIDLKQPLKEGGQFPLTLTFKSGRTIDMTVPVMTIGSSGEMTMPDTHHH